MKRLYFKTITVISIISFLNAVNAMDELTISKLPKEAQTQIALPMIADFLLSQQKPKMLGHDDVVYATSISPDSKHIVTGSFDSTAKIWDKDGKLECILRGHKGLINVVAISANNEYVATGTFDNSEQEIDRTVKIWDMQTCALLHTLGEKESERHLTSITALAISPNNTYIVTGSADHTVKIWDIKTGQQLISFGGITPNTPGWTNNWIHSIVISADSKHVVIGSADGTTIILDMTTGNYKQMQRHILNAKVLTMGIAGNKLVTGSWDGTTKLWDITNDQLLYTFGNRTNKVLSVAISKDGAYVVAGPADGENTAKVWNANTGQLLYTLAGPGGHSGLIKKVAISSDNKYVATASSDTTVKVWSLKTGSLLYTFKGHTKDIESLNISPDVHYLVSGSFDHTAKIWPLVLNLNVSEFNKKGSVLAWIKNFVTIPQADLIKRAYDATCKGQQFMLAHLSEDGKVFLTLPDYVRLYLLKELNIELVKPEKPAKSSKVAGE